LIGLVFAWGVEVDLLVFIEPPAEDLVRASIEQSALLRINTDRVTIDVF
jgi:hypothetical protein